MQSLTTLYRPGRFFALDFALTWGPLWLAVIGVRAGWFELNIPFILVASISATVAALVMIYSSGSRVLIRDYWDRVFNIRRIGGRGWLLILLLIPLVNLAAILISLAFGGSLDQLRLEPAFLSQPLFFTAVILLFGPVPEELGWRGYGIDSLRSRMNLFKASLLLAVIWSVWHIPLVFLPGSYQHGLLDYIPGLIAFFLSLIPTEIIIDWLFYNNRRSTLAAILVHFSINYLGELFQFDAFTKVIQTGVLFLIAAIIVVTHREMFFIRRVPAGDAYSVPTCT